jgi:hypothetical protein
LRPEQIGASAEFLRLPLFNRRFGRKNSSRGDYSEHGTITQAQLAEKRGKNAVFGALVWKTPQFSRFFVCQGPRPSITLSADLPLPHKTNWAKQCPSGIR